MGTTETTAAEFLRSKYKELESAEFLSFKDIIDPKTWRTRHLKSEPKLRAFESAGCYVLFKTIDKTVIYVGQAGSGHNIRNRFNDLFYGAHSLRDKLSLVEGDEDKAREFLSDKCLFKFVKTSTTSEAVALEGFLILVLQPELNKEVIADQKQH